MYGSWHAVRLAGFPHRLIEFVRTNKKETSGLEHWMLSSLEVVMQRVAVVLLMDLALEAGAGAVSEKDSGLGRDENGVRASISGKFSAE